MNLFVREDKWLTINVIPTTTIKEVKRKIKEKNDMALCDQRITYGGEQLEDHKMVKDYPLSRDATLWLFSKRYWNLRNCWIFPSIEFMISSDILTTYPPTNIIGKEYHEAIEYFLEVSYDKKLPNQVKTGEFITITKENRPFIIQFNKLKFNEYVTETPCPLMKTWITNSTIRLYKDNELEFSKDVTELIEIQHTTFVLNIIPLNGIWEENQKYFVQFINNNVGMQWEIIFEDHNIQNIGNCSVCYQTINLVQLIHSNGVSHRCVCTDCSKQIQRLNNQCPICRKDILIVIENENEH